MVFFYGQVLAERKLTIEKSRPDHYPAGSEMGAWSRWLRRSLRWSTDLCQVAAGARRRRCRTRKGQLLFAENRKPTLHVESVILARLIGDTEFSAQEGRSEFSHEFFHGIGISAETSREIAIEARRMTAPVYVLMEEDGIEGFGRAARFGADESGTLRHVDAVGERPVERAIAAILHFRSDPDDETFDGLQADGAIFEYGRLILPATDLSGVEDGG